MLHSLLKMLNFYKFYFISTLTPFESNFAFAVTRSCCNTTSSAVVWKSSKSSRRLIIAKTMRSSVYARLIARQKGVRVSHMHSERIPSQVSHKLLSYRVGRLWHTYLIPAHCLPPFEKLRRYWSKRGFSIHRSGINLRGSGKILGFWWMRALVIPTGVPCGIVQPWKYMGWDGEMRWSLELTPRPRRRPSCITALYRYVNEGSN